MPGPTYAPHPAELARMGELAGRPDLNEAWAMEQQSRMRLFEESKAQGAWVNEFGASPPMTSAVPSIQQNLGPRIDCGLFGRILPDANPTRADQQGPSYIPPIGAYGNPMSMGMYGMNMNSSMYQGVNAGYDISADQSKGKGKSREADFEAAFAQVAASLSSAQAETSRIVEVEDGVNDIEEALKNASLKSGEGQAEYGTDFKKWVCWYMPG